jgi:two-component system response regulator MtrA
LKTQQNHLELLFADDEPDIQALVSLLMKKAGHSVTIVSDGQQALDAWRRRSFDCILLDGIMPVMDGIEVLKRIRRVSSIPIILLTARGMESDVVAGLEAGADDYIVKPFRNNELLARINVVVNRSARMKSQDQRKLTFGNVIVDVKEHRVSRDGCPIDVTPLEFQLLLNFLRNPGTVFSKEELLKNIWGYSHIDPTDGIDFNMIEAAIRRLRKKLEVNPSEPNYIHTVWGSGYRFGN